MKTLYVVEGYCGEYEDYREWPVCAYLTRKLAQAHADRAKRRADELLVEHGSYSDIPAKANRYDRAMSGDYTGTSYRVYRIGVRDVLL